MEKKLLNEKFFNLKRLALPAANFISHEFLNLKFIHEKCTEAGQQRKAFVFIKEPGYGVKTALEKFVRQTGFKYYFSDCSTRHTMRNILTDFLKVDLPAFIPVYKSNEKYAVRALAYLFKSDPKRKRIVVLHNAQNLRLYDFEVIHDLVYNLKGTCGFVMTLSQKRYEELEKMSDRYSFLRDLLTDLYQWYNIPPPEPEELKKVCEMRGILGIPVIDRLLKKAQDFKLLNLEVDKVKEMLRERGYFKT